MARRNGIREVAAAANVSVTTVSHALSGRGRVTETTRQRVQRIAAELDYQPHAGARGLVTGRGMLLAVQVSGASDTQLLPKYSFFSDLLNAVSMRAIELGYAPMLLPPAATGSIWAGIPVDGALLIDPTGSERLLADCARREVPAVGIGRVPGRPDMAWIDNDHAALTREVLDHLEEMGCRRPALLTVAGGVGYAVDAAQAYRSWCQQRRITPTIGYATDMTEPAASAATLALLDRTPVPDAIYTTLDAPATIWSLRERGLVTPHDLALVTLNDSPAARLADPPVTSTDPCAHEIGRLSVDMLVDLVEGRELASRHRLVAATLLRRHSSTGRVR